jgi:cytochrome c oxidase cbb3-type subunit 3
MKKFIILLIGFFSSSFSWAGNVGVATKSVYQDPLFYFLVFIAVLLLFFIWQFQRVFVAISKEKIRKRKSENQSHRNGSIFIILFGMTDYGRILGDLVHNGLGNTPMNALAFIVLVEVLVVLYYAQQIRKLTEKPEDFPKAPDEDENATATSTSKFWNWINKSVEIHEESSILTNHDYDGIQELDNSLPPWWIYGFYITIVFAIGYMGYYHMSGGPSSEQEYKAQMDKAELEIAAYQANMKDAVNENSVVLLNNPSEIAAGAATFQSLCVSCHGSKGEGVVGPNLTDAYWKHGGDIKDLFKTIKYGVKGTGMKSWKTDISAAQMAQVASYILSLQGSQPPGGKEPEGVLYIPNSSSDSIQQNNIVVDSLKTASK